MSSDGAAPIGEPVIQARGLSKRFNSKAGAVRALEEVDIDVGRGQMLVLLGPSGCGKTTLLRCIGGLEHPDAGEIRLAGRIVTSCAQRINVLPENRHLGMMFQSYGLWPHMTVQRNVAYPLENQAGLTRADIATRVGAMLETMGLSALGDRYPGQLSGGQQQRVALARALVAAPTALLFDEPLSNVDAQVRKRLREEIRQMKEERGFAGVYVTHDQEEAMALADSLAVMEDGVVRQIGAPWEIYRRPKSLYVARFIGEANALPAHIAETGGGMTRCETALGSLLIQQEDTVTAPGRHGHVIVRPEDVVILDTAVAIGANRCDGTVAACILLGPQIELRVQVGSSELRACVSSLLAGKYAPGSAVSLQLPPDRLAWVEE